MTFQTVVGADGQVTQVPFTPEQEAALLAAIAERDRPRTPEEQRSIDNAALRNATGDAIVLLVRLIQRLMVSAPTLLKPADFSPAVRQAYQDAKAIADRIDPP